MKEISDNGRVDINYAKALELFVRFNDYKERDIDRLDDISRALYEEDSDWRVRSGSDYLDKETSFKVLKCIESLPPYARETIEFYIEVLDAFSESGVIIDTEHLSLQSFQEYQQIYKNQELD